MNNRKKIAMVLTGHLRTYEENFPYLKENFLNYHDVDIFITTWDFNYVGKRTNEKNARIMPTEEIEKMMSIYPNVKKILINNTAEIKEKCKEEVRKAIEEKRMGLWDIKNKQYRVHAPYRSTDADLLKVGSAWYCVQEGVKCIENPNQYDFIIKSRFDVRYTKPFIFKDYDLVATPPAPHKKIAYKFRNYIIYGKPIIYNLMINMFKDSLEIMCKYRNFSAERTIEHIFDLKLPTYFVDPDLVGARDYHIIN